MTALKTTCNTNYKTHTLPPVQFDVLVKFTAKDELIAKTIAYLPKGANINR